MPRVGDGREPEVLGPRGWMDETIEKPEEAWTVVEGVGWIASLSSISI